GAVGGGRLPRHRGRRGARGRHVEEAVASGDRPGHGRPGRGGGAVRRVAGRRGHGWPERPPGPVPVGEGGDRRGRRGRVRRGDPGGVRGDRGGERGGGETAGLQHG